MGLLDNLYGTPTYGGLLGEQDQQAARRQAMLGITGALLEAGGPSPVPVSTGQAIGRSLQAGNLGQQSSIEQSLKAALLRKQMEPRPVAPPDSVQEYMYAKQNGFKGGFEDWKTLNAGNKAQPAASLQEYQQYVSDQQAAGQPAKPFLEFSKDFAASRAMPNYMVADVAGVPTLVASRTGQTTGLATLPQVAGNAGAIAGAKQAGQEQATTAAIPGQVQAKTATERQAGFIDAGLAAADTLPVLNRAITLLDGVSTGGLSAAQLWATNALGVTGANEAELSNNLGKAVLQQLRTTFGAQFTENEGARLAQIEADYGKSTEGNKRLLGQAKQIADRAARRGLSAAEAAGDTFAAQEIKKSMEMDLAPKDGSGPKIGDVVKGYKYKGGDPSLQTSWVKQ